MARDSYLQAGCEMEKTDEMNTKSNEYCKNSNINEEQLNKWLKKLDDKMKNSYKKKIPIMRWNNTILIRHILF